MNIKPVCRKSNIVVQEVNDEVLIYDLNNNKAFCLNSTCANVWQACNGERTVSEINAIVASKLNLSVSEDLIWLALDQLKEVDLIENQAEFKTKFEGLSRREVIRKVGIASLAAIPILTSITTPVAAQTASTCVGSSGKSNGCSCTASAQCSSGCCKQSGQSANTCVATAQGNCL